MSAAPEQPPRAADVPVAHIPAGVLEAIDDFEEAAITLHEHRSFATEIDFNIAQAAMLKTIATALREAREQGAADTARLAELVAAADDILPDDWDTRRCPKFTRLWLAIGEMQNAARAAEPEGSDAT